MLNPTRDEDGMGAGSGSFCFLSRNLAAGPAATENGWKPRKSCCQLLWMQVRVDEGHVGETDVRSLGHPPSPPMNPRAPCPQTLLGSSFGDVFTTGVQRRAAVSTQDALRIGAKWKLELSSLR